MQLSCIITGITVSAAKVPVVCLLSFLCHQKEGKRTIGSLGLEPNGRMFFHLSHVLFASKWRYISIQQHLLSVLGFLASSARSCLQLIREREGPKISFKSASCCLEEMIFSTSVFNGTSIKKKRRSEDATVSHCSSRSTKCSSKLKSQSELIYNTIRRVRVVVVVVVASVPRHRVQIKLKIETGNLTIKSFPSPSSRILTPERSLARSLARSVSE